jgi:broad specificity phosphatase PhoE
MKFIFIRHAESEANRKEILGSFETPLTPEGIEQARTAADVLTLPVDVIFSSSLKRTLQTAEPFARKFNLSVNPHEALQEKHYGKFIGRPRSELQDAVRNDLAYKGGEWGGDYTQWGGESGIQVRDRVKEFVEEVKKAYPNKTILAFTHVAVIRTLHRLYSKLEDYHFPIANVSVHEFDL